MRRNLLRRGAVLAAVTAVALSGCAEGTGDAGPDGGVDVAEIQEPQNFYEGEYLGQRVTITAVVTDVISPDSVEVRGVEVGGVEVGGVEVGGADHGEESLLVMTAAPVAPRVGDRVTVTGTVGQFHRLAEDDYAPGSYDRYEPYETEPYLYDAVVEPA